MKRLLLGTFALALAGNAAGEEINQTLDVSKEPWIEISNTAGDIEIEGWSRSQVEITGELGSGVEELIFEADGDNVIIKVKVPRGNSSRISSELIIRSISSR